MTSLISSQQLSALFSLLNKNGQRRNYCQYDAATFLEITPNKVTNFSISQFFNKSTSRIIYANNQKILGEVKRYRIKKYYYIFTGEV